ncbi:MAG: hypothetical protein J3K34DRAFT_522732 [Monoraphidium minutum]|nr:MAG: hypothetical protein J3K34DRAFT_522732 [Monoraphidium minutum]
MPVCQPGLIRLDEPLGPPERVSLPFCEEFRCSCCNASHALTLARGFARVLDDGEAAPPCKAALRRLACRPCDPEVGTGAKPAVCLSLCDLVYDSCKEDYFAFSGALGVLVPCGTDGGGALVCSALREHAAGGREFCKAAGLPVSEAAPCFDGSGAPEGSDALCAHGDAARRLRRERQERARRRGGGARGFGAGWAAGAAQLLCTCGAGGLAVALAMVAPRLLAAHQRRQRRGTPAMAAAARAAGGGGSGGGGGGGGSGLLSAEEQRQAAAQAARMREAAGRAAAARAKAK